MSKHSIVILIDHKGRDLMGASLIAHHLTKFGIKTHLEPLESWRSCLSAWKPSMILFNHLLSEKLADYTQELKQCNVLVATLLNEGFCLNEQGRHYLSKPRFSNIHCDLFLAWNSLHRDCLVEHQFCTPPENAHTVGIPRFDFYKKPWSDIYLKKKGTGKIKVLLNTTFAIAHFYHRSEKDQYMLYAALGDGEIPETVDYKALIKAHYEGLTKLPDFIRPLLESDRFEITLRPHPREELSFYQDFIKSLSPDQQNRIRLDKKESIFSAIINADVILNCEDCTTSVESWIANKPTLTLTFAKNPLFLTPEYADKAPLIHTPEDLLPAIDKALTQPEQPEYQDLRNAYLDKWLHQIDGNSALRAATLIHKLIKDKDPNPQSPRTLNNIRRAIKLHFLRTLNEPSHAQIHNIFKRYFFGESKKQTIKYRDYLKSVRPSEAKEVQELISKIDPH